MMARSCNIELFIIVNITQEAAGLPSVTWWTGTHKAHCCHLMACSTIITGGGLAWIIHCIQNAQIIPMIQMSTIRHFNDILKYLPYIRYSY